MEENNCENCTLRKKYDEKPKSFGGRFWRFHINFCPGWKMYMNSLDDEKRNEIASHYRLKKWMNN
ncbi:MAG: hypothetical protein JW798_13170 [Prolixibacteraceae bacterium]|nr:hypothetical protein [Prolixibacteraceae bacterium]